jgi:hypothetical protein
MNTRLDGASACKEKSKRWDKMKLGFEDLFK